MTQHNCHAFHQPPRIQRTNPRPFRGHGTMKINQHWHCALCSPRTRVRLVHPAKSLPLTGKWLNGVFIAAKYEIPKIRHDVSDGKLIAWGWCDKFVPSNINSNRSNTLNEEPHLNAQHWVYSQRKQKQTHLAAITTPKLYSFFIFAGVAVAVLVRAGLREENGYCCVRMRCKQYLYDFHYQRTSWHAQEQWRQRVAGGNRTQHFTKSDRVVFSRAHILPNMSHAIAAKLLWHSNGDRHTGK